MVTLIFIVQNEVYLSYLSAKVHGAMHLLYVKEEVACFIGVTYYIKWVTTTGQTVYT